MGATRRYSGNTVVRFPSRLWFRPLRVAGRNPHSTHKTSELRQVPGQTYRHARKGMAGVPSKSSVHGRFSPRDWLNIETAQGFGRRARSCLQRPSFHLCFRHRRLCLDEPLFQPRPSVFLYDPPTSISNHLFDPDSPASPCHHDLPPAPLKIRAR